MLYVVQRMAMLSAVITLAALLAYVHGRQRMESGRIRAGTVWVWLAFPALVGLATLSKENGVLAVPLAAVIELAYFTSATSRRPLLVVALFGLTLVLPLRLRSRPFTLHPERLTNGYIGRYFTLVERVLTEPRILWDYVGAILMPNGPTLGLFHDDYPLSRELLEPPATIVAIVAWVAAIAGALALRRRAPRSIAFGVAFLVAHAMESTVLPLELYFEHRNYLAALGVLTTVAGLGALALERLGHTTPAMRRAMLALTFAVPTTFLIATFARSRVWSSEDTLMRRKRRTTAAPHA